MPARTLVTEWQSLLGRLRKLDEVSIRSNLAIYSPSTRHRRFFHQLFEFYERADPTLRAKVRREMRATLGVCNQLLGYVYVATRKLKDEPAKPWLHRGLLAAAIEDSSFDPRDSLLALAKLYCTAEEAGLDPQREFRAASRLASTRMKKTLSGFSSFEVLEEERTRRQAHKKSSAV